MALSISSSFVTLYDAEVKQKYQAERALAGLVREKQVEGNIVKFNKLGSGVATVRTPQAEIVPMNVTYSQVSATMTDYTASEYSDIFNQSHVNFNDRAELVQTAAMAIGRRMDQVVIDALDACTPGTVANTIAEDGTAGSASNLNTGKIRAAAKVLNTNNVPPSDRVLLIHADNLASLLAQTSATSADFNSVRALVDGQISTWLGFKVVVIGDRSEGGLTKDGSNDRSCYAFHKNAVGMGLSMNQRSEINYVPDRTSWLVTNMFGAGAVAIEDSTAGGIVKITCREA
jgi:hypothetical protein